MAHLMKKRKGFNFIGINQLKFQYAITHGKPWGLIVYDENEQRYEFRDLMSLGVPKEESNGVWRGKHGDAAWGKRPVAWIIKKYIIEK